MIFAAAFSYTLELACLNQTNESVTEPLILFHDSHELIYEAFGVQGWI